MKASFAVVLFGLFAGGMAEIIDGDHCVPETNQCLVGFKMKNGKDQYGNQKYKTNWVNKDCSTNPSHPCTNDGRTCNYNDETGLTLCT